jgi:hypothetical protein
VQPAYVWPDGPDVVRFTALDAAELHRLLSANHAGLSSYYTPQHAHPLWAGRDGFLRLIWLQLGGRLVDMGPHGAELCAQWVKAAQLLRARLQPLRHLYYVDNFRVVFRLGDHSPHHQDKIAYGDTYQAGAIHCLLSCCRHATADKPASWRHARRTAAGALAHRRSLHCL